MANGSYIGQVKIGENYYPVGSILYGVCNTAAATQDKTTILSNYSGTDTGVLNDTSVFDDNNLTKGVTVHIKFINSNTYDGDVYLKVANATKHKIVRYGTTNIGKTAATSWVAGSIVSFTYDGTNWIMNTGIDSNDNTTYLNGTGISIDANNKINHSNSITAQNTQGVYPITVDAQGHIASMGTKVTLGAAAGKDVDTSIAAGSTSGNVPTSAAVATLITNSISEGFALNDAMVFKGTLGTGGTITNVPTNGYSAGATYKVITAGEYAGINCEVGDMLIAINDGPASGTSIITTDWTVVQTNIDGAVTGPTSVTADGNIALFNGTTGKIIKDSGIAFDDSTVNKWLTQNGTWTTPTYSQVGAASSTHTQAVNRGGTNITSYTKGDILYASAKTTLTKLGIGTAEQILKATTDGPSWSTPSISVTANTNGSVVTGVALNDGTQPSFTQGTLAKAEVANGTLTLTNQTKDTFSKGTYPSLGTISKANLGVSLT